jgi:branched-chain amino acid transport system ATP-binding protein
MTHVKRVEMPEELLSIVGLTKRFGSLAAVDQLDMVVEPGQICGLIGPNGSGKTTVFNLVSGVLRADEGQVSLAGRDITGSRPHQIARLGMMRTFQRAWIMPQLTCAENVMLGMHSTTRLDLFGTYLRVPWTASAQERRCGAQARELLELVGLADSADRLAGDLVWVEAQLLQIARALAASPKILLLDEPTAGMGGHETERVRELVRQVNANGVTVLLIAHDIGLVMSLCHHIVAINFGRKICEGTPSQVRADDRVAEAYLGVKDAHLVADDA